MLKRLVGTAFVNMKKPLNKDYSEVFILVI